MTSKIVTFFKLVKNVRNFLTYLKDYFGFSKKGLILLRLRDGSKYLIRAGSTDRFIINEIRLHKEYNPRGFEIKEKDRVVDIGAHIGIFSVMAARSARKGRVYSFEPGKENFSILEKNMKINKLGNLILENKAVNGTGRDLKFFISQTRNKGQNSKYRLDESQKEVKVKAVSFKNLINKIGEIDFLKLDCEGGEYEILESLSKKEFEKIKKISMEYHNYEDKKGEDIAEILKKNGFKIRFIRDGEKFGRIYAIKV